WGDFGETVATGVAIGAVTAGVGGLIARRLAAKPVIEPEPLPPEPVTEPVPPEPSPPEPPPPEPLAPAPPKYGPGNLPKDPGKLLEAGWQETTPPGMKANSASREFTDPETGMRVRFDPAKPGA